MTNEPAMNPVGHRRRPIEDLPDNWRNLVDPDLAYLVEYWNRDDAAASRQMIVCHGTARTRSVSQ